MHNAKEAFHVFDYDHCVTVTRTLKKKWCRTEPSGLKNGSSEDTEPFKVLSVY